MNKKTLTSRSFLSIGTFLFFIVLTISGIALQKIGHAPYTFLKIFFIVAHNISAMLFLIFSIGHIIKNWKAIKSYMSGNAKKIISREMLIGVILLIITLIICCVVAIRAAKEHGIEIM